MQNAVIYARYSSDKQNEQSIEGQLEVCYAYAERCGYNVIEEYIDRALTGKTDRRPAFLRMIEDSKKRQFQYVIVYKLDRFSRLRYDSAVYRHILKQYGVRVLSAQEQISDTPEGILLESMLEGYNEYYSLELAQKVRRGNKQNIEKGLSIGGNRLYGYRAVDKKYEINEDEAKTVRYLFEQYAIGKTKKEIFEELNRKGILFNGKTWNSTAFQHNFRCRKYIGEYEYEGEVYTNIYPPIVDKETFFKVQARLDTYRHTRAKTKENVQYLLAGKIFCAKCGHSMVGDCGRSKSGKFYYYYSCSTRKSGLGECAKKAERKDYLEWYVCEQTIEYLKQPGNIEHIAETTAEFHRKESNRDVIKSLERKIAAGEAEIKKIAERFIAADQQAVFDALNARAAEVDNQLHDLRRELAQQRLLCKLPLEESAIIAFLKKIVTLDIMEEQNRIKIIDSLVNAIYLDDDKIIIYFNVREAKLVSFIELLDDLDSLEKSGVRVENSLDHQKNAQNTRVFQRVFLFNIVGLFCTKI